jgi:hypothetical protein
MLNDLLKIEQEIEMGKILYEFFIANQHLFSPAVLEAALRLRDEVIKLENI